MRIYRILSVLVCLMIITCGLSSAINKYNYNLEETKSFSSIDIVDSFPCPPGCNDPQDMAFGDGFLWLVDKVDELIYKINPSNGNAEGTILTQGNTPCGLTWANSHLWQSDSGSSGKIYEIDPDTGDQVSEFDAYSSVRNSFGLAFDGTYLLNRVYDPLPTYIYKYTLAGEYDSRVRLSLNPYAKSGLAFDGNYIYCCTPVINSIWIHKENGHFCDILQGSGSAPAGLTWDGDYLWCADSETDTIYKLEITMCQIEFDIEPSISGEILFDTSYGQYNFSDGDVTHKTAGDYEILALASYGYGFDHWSKTGDATIQNSNNNPTTITINGDCSIKAHFIPDNKNNPPYTPIKPTGPESGVTGKTYTYQTTTSDSDGDLIWYKWEWGDATSGWLGPYDSYEICEASHSWSNSGTWNVRVKAKDVNSAESYLSQALPVTISLNLPPDTPNVLIGPEFLFDGDKGTFIARATDSNGNKIRYIFDFEDEFYDETEWVESGQYASISKSLSYRTEHYNVRVKAEDEHGLKSGWSESLRVDVFEKKSWTTFNPIDADTENPFSGCSYDDSNYSDWPNGAQSESAANVSSGVIGGRTFTCLRGDWAEAEAWQEITFYTGIQKTISINAEIKIAHCEDDLNAEAYNKIGYKINKGTKNMYLSFSDDQWDDIIDLILGILEILTGWTSISYLITLAHFYYLYTQLEDFSETETYNMIFDMETTDNGQNTIDIGAYSKSEGGGDGDHFNGFAKAIFVGQVVEIEVDGIAPPRTPIITGPKTGLVDQSYEFTATCIDPNNDDIRYKIDWGDGTISDWTDYTDSGSSKTISHIYNEEGSFIIKVLAEDIDKYQSFENYHLINIEGNNPPERPNNLNPSNHQTGVPLSPRFEWDCNDPDGDPLTFDFYLGKNNPPNEFNETGIRNKYFEYPNTLIKKQKYYWKIVAHDDDGNSNSSYVHDFTTKKNGGKSNNITPKISIIEDAYFRFEYFIKLLSYRFPFMGKILNQIIL